MKTKSKKLPAKKAKRVKVRARVMWSELPQIFTAIPQVFHQNKPFTKEPMPVLVLPFDAANREAIILMHAKALCEIEGLVWADQADPMRSGSGCDDQAGFLASSRFALASPHPDFAKEGG